MLQNTDMSIVRIEVRPTVPVNTTLKNSFTFSRLYLPANTILVESSCLLRAFALSAGAFILFSVVFMLTGFLKTDKNAQLKFCIKRRKS
jgi:hypothetical protein